MSDQSKKQKEIRIDNWNVVPDPPKHMKQDCINSMRKNSYLSYETKKELMEKLQQDYSTENFHLLAKEYKTKVSSIRTWLRKLNKGQGLERKGTDTSRIDDLYMELADWASEQSIQYRRIVSGKEILEELRKLIEKAGIKMVLNDSIITRFMKKFDIRAKILDLLVKLGYLTQIQRNQKLQQYKKQKKQDKLQCKSMETMLEES